MIETHHGITVDLSRDKLFDSLGLARLKDSYMKPSEVSPQERYAYVANAFGSNPAHAQRIYDYASKHWLSFSTPILSFGKNARGLPISCFLSYLQDSAAGLVDTLSETNWLSMLGGGVGVHVRIRSADSKSVGVLPHLKIYDASCEAYRQGETRRGSYAMYLDISHPDVLMFTELRKPTGDPRMRCENLHHGINITDEFMNKVKHRMLDASYDDSWELIDPASKKVVDTVSAKELWIKILTTRIQTGEPYIHFIDTSNRALPQWLVNKGLKIHGSNLCAEIMLPTSPERTAVCCLSSLNLDYYDEWKNDKLFYQDVMELLDNVLQYFIDNAPDTISRAKFSAFRERSIGIGVLGFHSYLQSKMIPFDSAMSKAINIKIFRNIQSHINAGNIHLGSLRGEAPDAIGTGLRFSHTMAIAPTASSSIIMGNTSPSIEPYRANTYRQDTLSGASFARNKHLVRIVNLRATTVEQADDIWKSINSHDGSIQQLSDFFTSDELAVFKTAMELDQHWIIELAGDRAPYIDQGQSINVFFRPDAHVKYLHSVHYSAWLKGLKSLYYCRSEKIRKADKVSIQIQRHIIDEVDMRKLAMDEAECLACQ